MYTPIDLMNATSHHKLYEIMSKVSKPVMLSDEDVADIIRREMGGNASTVPTSSYGYNDQVDKSNIGI